jgi:hypothetical protein
MPTTRCRECREPVAASALECLHCGAPRPERAEFHGEGYEWKSGGTWMGEPLVHIAFGLDTDGRARTARGVIAVGQRARGVVAIGIVAVGFVAIGIIALGAVSFGVVAVALLAAAGVNAFAPFAFGVVAVGFAAGGLQAIGWKILFSLAR